MSGICGIAFYDQERRVTIDHLFPMVKALAVTRQDQGLTAALGAAGIGAQRFPGRLAGIVERAVHGCSLALAFHGSIHNFGELFVARAEHYPLMGLLSLYLQDGSSFVQRLRGEFALGLWDGRHETFYLATDRFRVHPLFYYYDAEKLVFASRMQGLLSCPLPLQRTINPEALVDVVASSIIPTPKTIFREVQKLPPGHVLTYHRGHIRLSSYWDINFLQPDGLSEVELARKLKAYVTDAISVRLAGDAASDGLGTFLSGGIDSSTVTGVLTQLTKRPVKSFSIGFEEHQFNELDYADIAACTFGAEHYKYCVTPHDTYEIMPEVLKNFDEPFANASAIPTYFCAKLARQHGVDILYAGDGGDELFAGNERYATQRLFEPYQKISPWLREYIITSLMFALADSLRWKFLVKGKKYIQRASIPYPERLSSYAFFKVVPPMELLTDGLLQAVGSNYDPYALVGRYYFQAPARSELDRQLYIDLKLTISDNDLFKVTRTTEAVGVTVRFPFLDHRLAEFAASVPAAIKMPGRQLRAFFKKAYADLLPMAIRSKRKHGFGLPIPIWLRTDKRLNEMMHELVLSPQSIQRGYFRPKALANLIERHKIDHTSFYGTALWNLMVLELWHRTSS